MTHSWMAVTSVTLGSRSALVAVTSKVCGFCSPARRSVYANGDEHGSSGPPSSVQRKDACGSVEPNSIVPVVAVPPVAGGALVIVTSGATSVPLTNSNSAGVESGVPSSPTAKTWNRCSPYGTSVYCLRRRALGEGRRVERAHERRAGAAERRS